MLDLRQAVLAVAARGASFDPVDERLDLLTRERLVVSKRGDVRIRVPRRHAVGADSFADHRREGFHLLVAVEAERSDAALLVAGDALLFDQRSDRRSVRDLGELGFAGRRAVREADDRAGDRRGGDGRSLASENSVDRVSRKRAGVGDLHRLRFDHEGLANRRRADLAADELQVVLQDRGGEAVLGRVSQHGFARVFRVRVHDEDLDALGFVGGLDLREFRTNLRHVASAAHHEHDRRSILVAVQFAGIAIRSHKAEVVDARGSSRQRRFDRRCHVSSGCLLGASSDCEGKHHACGSHGQGAFHRAVSSSVGLRIRA